MDEEYGWLRCTVLADQTTQDRGASFIHSAAGLPQADFTLVVAQSRPTTPEKEWRAETFFSAFCQNFATWLSLITIK